MLYKGSSNDSECDTFHMIVKIKANWDQTAEFLSREVNNNKASRGQC